MTAYCACHAQDKPGAGKGFMGFKPLKYHCSEPSCQRAMPSEEKVVVPSSFFRKAFSQVMASKSIQVRYDLNTYRMVSKGSEAMHYVKHGNLEKLKMCIRTGEATLWYTAPDEWSLLHVGEPMRHNETS